MIRTVVFAIVMIAVIGASRVAAAQASSGIVWSTPAIGCYVASTTTAHALVYDATYGEIDFVPNDTGTYHLVCPVPSWWNDIIWGPYELNVYYNDDANHGCSVSGVIRYYTLPQPDNGSVPTTTPAGYGTVATFSGANGTGGQFVNYTTAQILSTWDVDDNVYWLDFTVTQSLATGTTPYCGVINVSLFADMP